MAANATTPDGVPNQPRKASWKRWTLAAACVLVIALAVLFLKVPTHDGVSVRFVGSTYDNGKRVLHFKGTNGLPRTISYYGFVKLTRPVRVANTSKKIFTYGVAFDYAAPGGAFTISFDEPEQSMDWRFTWYFWDNDRARTRLEKIRATCYVFMTQHGMGSLARPLNDNPRRHIIPASDLKD